jgi:hypothetical protein
MLKNKLIIFFSYCVILNYFGEGFEKILQLFAPVIYIGFGGSLWSLLNGVLLILVFLYLMFSSFIFPYHQHKNLLLIIIVFLHLSLIPSLLNIIQFPNASKISFIITYAMFTIASISVYVKLKTIKHGLKALNQHY